jgi:pSer/pThr/pTyr-binding forkhead associated (FHA) protein
MAFACATWRTISKCRWASSSSGAPGCQLSLDDPLVSRRHAVLGSADGVFRQDLGGRNAA